jgi:hypothetical protein
MSRSYLYLSLRYRADKIRNLSRRSRGSAQADSHFALRNFFSVSSVT